MGQGKQINSPNVSVIIPVYNTGPYVEEAVRSIMNQTLRDVEIIIINDGSTDNSLSVIEKLAREDNRIQYFSQPNQGQSIARNVGIEKAGGEYLYFMDSDDILEKNALDICYNTCSAERLDFVFFDAISFGEINKSVHEYDRKNQLDTRIYTGIEMLNNLLDIRAYRVPPWLNFINHSFLRENNITFDPNFIIYEDQIFSVMLYLSSKRVAYIPLSLFRRRLREGSLMTKSYSINNVYAYFKIADKLVSLGEDKDEHAVLVVDRVIKQMLNAAIYTASKLTIKERLLVGIKAFKGYFQHISLKTWIILFCPWTTKIKSIFRRKS